MKQRVRGRTPGNGRRGLPARRYPGLRELLLQGRRAAVVGSGALALAGGTGCLPWQETAGDRTTPDDWVYQPDATDAPDAPDAGVFDPGALAGDDAGSFDLMPATDADIPSADDPAVPPRR